MQGESVWLGPLRGPIRVLMFVLIGLTVLATIWAATDLSGREGLAQFKPSFAITSFRSALLLALAALFVASVYFSDTIGSIEPRPTGPFDIFSVILGRAAMIGTVFIVCVMFYEVIARYVFDSGTWWANELSLWAAGFLFLLAGLYAMQQRSHIRIYIVYDMMPRWAQKAADCVTVILIWVFTACLIWGGYNEAVDKFARMETFGTAWDPPLPATIKMAILVVISLVALQALSNLIADWNKAPESHSPLDDIDATEIENIRKTLEEKP